MAVGEDEATGEGGGVPTGELFRSTGVISCLPLVVISSSPPFSPDRAPPGGGFALPEVSPVPEVVVAALEVNGLVGAAGASPFVRVAFLASPSLPSAV